MAVGTTKEKEEKDPYPSSIEGEILDRLWNIEKYLEFIKERLDVLTENFAIPPDDNLCDDDDSSEDPLTLRLF